MRSQIIPMLLATILAAVSLRGQAPTGVMRVAALGWIASSFFSSDAHC